VTEGAGVSVEELYRRDGERLWRALLLYSGDREVASDSVAEAFGQCTWRSPRSARRYALCVLFDFVFFGFVVPIAVGVLAVRGGENRWAGGPCSGYVSGRSRLGQT
jgi:hypothetical protein